MARNVRPVLKVPFIATRRCLVTMCQRNPRKVSQLCSETGVFLSSFMKFTVKLPDLSLIMVTLFVLFASSRVGARERQVPFLRHRF